MFNACVRDTINSDEKIDMEAVKRNREEAKKKIRVCQHHKKCEQSEWNVRHRGVLKKRSEKKLDYCIFILLISGDRMVDRVLFNVIRV